MDTLVEKEINVANNMKAIHRIAVLDLSAGNGEPPYEPEPEPDTLFGIEEAGGIKRPPWSWSCSPGIFAWHALRSLKPVVLDYYEHMKGTLDHLEGALEENLPTLGYRKSGDCWRSGNGLVVIQTIHDSGSNASIEHVDRQTAMLYSNDANAMTQFVMRPTFRQEIRARTAWCRGISTMGCNVVGNKRLSLEEREIWFGHVEAVETALPSHHDLLIAAIKGDAQQWAYLLDESIKGKWKEDLEKAARSAFKKYGYVLDIAWYKENNGAYEEIKDRLFLTHAERRAA